MRFENRVPDESVNYTIEHPLKEFTWLIVGVLGSLFIATLLIGYFAGEVAARMPYRFEKNLADQAAARLAAEKRSPQHIAIEAELNRLATRLAKQMTLPEGMQITVHYDDTPEINAFATLGANIVVFRGLLARMPDENALAMVLAHEIAHAQLRHPARSLGRGVAVGIVLSALSSNMGRNVASGVLNTTGGLSLLKYSRDQERDADAEALAAIAALYRHVGGAQDVFKVLKKAEGDAEALRVTMLSTHPLSQKRIDTIATLAGSQGWPLDGPRTPLPAMLRVSKSEG
jgi:predicted Zn-dependent protease